MIKNKFFRRVLSRRFFYKEKLAWNINRQTADI